LSRQVHAIFELQLGSLENLLKSLFDATFLA